MNLCILKPLISRKMNQAVMVCLVMILSLMIFINIPSLVLVLVPFLSMSHLCIKTMIHVNLMKTTPIPSVSPFPHLHPLLHDAPLGSNLNTLSDHNMASFFPSCHLLGDWSYFICSLMDSHCWKHWCGLKLNLYSN